MIHYTCDRCQRKVDTDQEPLFQIRIEFNCISPAEPNLDADEQAAKEFMEMEEMIDELTDRTDAGQAPSSQMSFDLCPECFTRYAQDPLARNASELGFSKN